MVQPAFRSFGRASQQFARNFERGVPVFFLCLNPPPRFHYVWVTLLFLRNLSQFLFRLFPQAQLQPPDGGVQEM